MLEECAAGASSLVVSFVCTGWGTYPGACFRSKLPRVYRPLHVCDFPWALLCGFTWFLSLFQEKVLHNVMSIFTFMGASVVRQDDSYSFEVITKTLDTVIPALIQVCASCVLSVLTHDMIDEEQTQQGSKLTF